MKHRSVTLRHIYCSILFGSALLAALLTPRLAAACNVPVFRYALEKWQAGKFEVFVFHKGVLTDDQKAAIQILRDVADADPAKANLKVEEVDLGEEQAKELVEFYDSLKTTELPVLTVLYPIATKIDTPFWTVPLTAANVKALLNSPARKKIAEEILKGTSAVWVFLKCGNKQKDEAAAQFLGKQVPHLEKTLKLPKLTDDPEDKLDNKTLPLKLKFTMLTVDRGDPAEAVLVKMLLHSERDEPGETPLRDMPEPMVFPVYGRGRAMLAAAGQGINEEHIQDAAKFVIGPCSCKIKEQNPGFDLLMQVAWESVLGERLVKEVELPPLAGIAKFKLPAKQLASLDSPLSELIRELAEAFPLPPSASANDPIKIAPEKPDSAGHEINPQNRYLDPTFEDNPGGSPENPKTDHGNNSSLFRNTLFAIAGGFGIVALVYVVTRARGHRGK